jgi:hypothetical protein
MTITRPNEHINVILDLEYGMHAINGTTLKKKWEKIKFS